MEVVNTLLAQPVVQGLILGQVKAFLEALAKKVDDEGLAKQHIAWLQPLLMTLTLIVTAITLALQGKLHEMDFNAVQTYILAAINMYLGAQASQAAGSKAVNKLADKVKGK